MSEEKGLVTKGGLGALTVGAAVGMDDVVTVFVTQYEDKLYDEKERLQKELKTAKQEQEKFEKAVLEGFQQQRSQYEHTMLLAIVSEVEGVRLEWNGANKKHPEPCALFTVKIRDTEDKSDSYSRNEFTKQAYLPITSADTDRRGELVSEVERISSELSEILTKIKGLNRKERQIRGRISALKLEEAGYSELMENEEIVQLIKLD